MTKTIILLSGGLDSATLLAHCINEGHNIECLNIDYGQRHKREIKSARNIAKHYSVSLHEIDLSVLKPLLGGSSLTDDIDVPEGHYQEESMKQTFVPNRNMIMLSIAGAYAVSEKNDFVAIGAHKGDHDIYPDCREEFLLRCESTLRYGNYHRVALYYPFIYKSKIDIVKEGLKLGVPYNLTTTCYKGGSKACGKCGSCTERLEAFEKNGVEDPLEYEE